MFPQKCEEEMLGRSWHRQVPPWTFPPRRLCRCTSRRFCWSVWPSNGSRMRARQSSRRRSVAFWKFQQQKTNMLEINQKLRFWNSNEILDLDMFFVSVWNCLVSSIFLKRWLEKDFPRSYLARQSYSKDSVGIEGQICDPLDIPIFLAQSLTIAAWNARDWPHAFGWPHILVGF